MTPLEFLNQLWQYKPEEQHILIWTYPDKRSRWFTGVSEAAEYVAGINGARDVYVGVGLAGKDYGPTRRCVSDEITGISGLASDLDLASEVHSKKALPRTVEQALSIVPPAMPPTIVIMTGNGVHCWWLLKEPYMFENEEDRRNAARLVARWHTMLQLTAAGRGWAYERLSDLARVLRIPGTKNVKDPANPKEVRVLSATDRRYNLSDFEELLDDAGIPEPEAEERAAREWKERFADKPLVVNLNARIPEEMLNAWMREDMRFENTWLRRRHDLKDQSQSGYDLALACFGVYAGLSEQQMVDLIIHHRALYSRPKRTTLDYFRRTISKASQNTSASAPLLVAAPSPTTGPPAPQGAPVAPEEDGAAQTASPTGAGSPDRTFLCRQISQALGVDIVRLVKFEGKDPTYHMQLAEGIIEFASVDKLINYGPVRSAIAAKVGRIIRKFKPVEWGTISQMLLDACLVEEATEEEDFEGSARAYLLDYLAETNFIPSIEGQRVQDHRRPMIVDRRILVCSSDFQGYLNKTKGLNLSVKAAASMLGAVGATKADRLRSAKFSSQKRWALPPSAFNPAEIKPSLAEGDHAEP